MVQNKNPYNICDLFIRKNSITPITASMILFIISDSVLPNSNAVYPMYRFLLYIINIFSRFCGLNNLPTKHFFSNHLNILTIPTNDLTCTLCKMIYSKHKIYIIHMAEKRYFKDIFFFKFNM